MKIAIIGPGIMDIPPRGWGAVEILIDEYRTELVRRGHEVLVVNTQDRERIISDINNYSPDFVHCQYDEFIDVLGKVECPFRAITSHFGYIDQVWRFPDYLKNIHQKIIEERSVNIFSLSTSIAQVYLSGGVHSSRIRVTPNGVATWKFRISSSPEKAERSIYLAKIDRRKRQAVVQGLGLDVDFVGNLAEDKNSWKGFNPSDKTYLGEWSREEVSNNLTEYGNLLLLSDGEAHPLVCLEALASGLGVVVSEAAIANLDISRPFISVLKESDILNATKMKSEINQNRSYALRNRKEIIQYAKQFDWSLRVDEYLNHIMNIRNQNLSATVSGRSKQIRVAILIIATGDYYIDFFDPLRDSILKFIEGDVHIFCFTDHAIKDCKSTTYINFESMGWPFDTLLRFHMFSEIAETLMDFDFVLYMDADMLITQPINVTMFQNDFIAVIHPGFEADPSSAAFEVNPVSQAFVPFESRKQYVQGCFFGARSAQFKYMVRLLRDHIDIDMDKGIIALWHDESHLNWFASNHDVYRVPCVYAYPEGYPNAEKAVIIHISKEHNKVRKTSSVSVRLSEKIREDSPFRRLYLVSQMTLQNVAVFQHKYDDLLARHKDLIEKSGEQEERLLKIQKRTKWILLGYNVCKTVLRKAKALILFLRTK